jgi:Rod binding domain-containing protein
MSGVNYISSMVPMEGLVIPADVRKAGKEAQETYRAAVGFEQMLVKQLTETLTKSSAFGGGEDGEGGAPAGYKDLLSDNLSGAIARAGGLGVAQAMYKSITQANGEETK